MPTEYELNDNIQEEVDRMINNSEMTEFAPLREHEILVATCVKINLDKHNEPKPVKGAVASLVKLSDMLKLFTSKQYVIAVDGYFWAHAEMAQKKAALHKALMQIHVEQSAEGDLKLKKRKPDIQEFSATVARFGPPVSEGIQRILPMLIAAGQQLAAAMTVTSSSDSELEPE
jgi:exosome complex RNA-binding protein Rrp4